MIWHARQHLPFPLPKWRPSLCLSCKAVGSFFRWEGAITQICCYRIFSVSLRTQPDAAAKLVIVGLVCPALEWRKLNGDNPDHHFDPSADWRTADLAVSRRLGLLPERWARVGIANHPHFGFDG